MSELFAVWSPATVVAAIAAGIGAGYLVIGPILRNPTYSAGLATPAEVGRLVAGTAMVIFTIFYVGQVLAAIALDDPLWFRILSRFTLIALYAACLGLGTTFAARRDAIRRAGAARARAEAERKQGGIS